MTDRKIPQGFFLFTIFAARKRSLRSRRFLSVTGGRSFFSRERSETVQTEQRGGFKGRKIRKGFSTRGLGELPNKRRNGDIVPCLRH